MADVEAFLRTFAEWARDHPGVRAAVLVGSWARGTPGPDSDVDLVVVVDGIEPWLADWAWATRFGKCQSAAVEEWGRVRSLRVHYADGLHVEFGFTTIDWTATPLDSGTAAVLAGGHRVLYDPERVFGTSGFSAAP